MEAALKLGRQYYVEAGQPARSLLIARRQSYHGNTLGALAIGGNVAPPPVRAAADGCAQRGALFRIPRAAEGQTSSDYTAALLAELEQCILAHGPHNLIGFVAETMVGATAGAVPPTFGYFRGVRKLCDQYGLLLILDEVMCGMGRTARCTRSSRKACCPIWWCWAKGWAPATSP
jgi:adenosylmethionine-8-amino-7-oxononanoate aminotransferase